MKKDLIIYGILIAGFIAYNFFFKVENERINAGINILVGGIIFGYIGYLAYTLLKRINKGR